MSRRDIYCYLNTRGIDILHVIQEGLILVYLTHSPLWTEILRPGGNAYSMLCKEIFRMARGAALSVRLRPQGLSK
mgnify:CR=1 FL=1